MSGLINEDEVYSDVLIDFDIHPIKQDLVRAVNEAAVKRSLRNLLLTQPGERFFKPYLGSRIHQYLFENITPQTTEALKSSIENTINTHEKDRVNLIDVIVTPLYEENTYTVKILYYLINKPDLLTYTVTLERTR